MKELILKEVNLNGPYKDIKLLLVIMDRVFPKEFSHEQFMKDLDELILSGELKEIEYTDHTCVTRTKSVYFSKSTQFILPLGVMSENDRSTVHQESEGNPRIPYKQEKGIS